MGTHYNKTSNEFITKTVILKSMYCIVIKSHVIFTLTFKSGQDTMRPYYAVKCLITGQLIIFT